MQGGVSLVLFVGLSGCFFLFVCLFVSLFFILFFLFSLGDTTPENNWTKGGYFVEVFLDFGGLVFFGRASPRFCF